MKRLLSLSLALLLTLSLAACGGGSASTSAPETQPSVTQPPTTQSTEAEPVELVIFAAASMTETLNELGKKYKAVAPTVTLTFNFDSSGTLKTQIEEGADCDVFISAAQKQMNQLDSAADATANEKGLDFVLQGTRVDLLENKVVLVVPEGNPAGIASFDDVSTDKVSLIALGNADVPVGQYSEEIFTNLGVWDALNGAKKITFGTNVKEVTSQVAEAAADCGVVYATDANSAGLEIVTSAPEGSHKPVVYPAAVLNITKHEAEARAFLDYLQTDACAAVFEAVGFAMAG